MNFRAIFDLFRDSLKGLNPNEVPVQAAALAFYALLSLAPLVTISIAVAGLIFSQAVVESQTVAFIESIVGKPAAQLIQDIIETNLDSTTSGLVAAISFVFLVFAASTVFWQLRVSLNTTWGLMPKAGNVTQNYFVTIKDRLLSIVAVLTVGLLLVTALLLNALAAGILQHLLADFRWVGWLLSLVVSPTAYLLIFAAIFKWLPSAKIKWRDVWPGAALTAVLFWIGGYVIWLYLSRSTVASIYGAAGSLVMFLLWIYSSAWIFLFGAKFTQVYTDRYGSSVIEVNSESHEPAAKVGL